MSKTALKTVQEVADLISGNSLVSDSHLVGNILWVIQTHTGGSFITAFEITQTKDGCEYRGYSEGSDPKWFSCPTRFLSQVTNVTCETWRKRVVNSTRRVRTII